MLEVIEVDMLFTMTKRLKKLAYYREATCNSRDWATLRLKDNAVNSGE